MASFTLYCKKSYLLLKWKKNSTSYKLNNCQGKEKYCTFFKTEEIYTCKYLIYCEITKIKVDAAALLITREKGANKSSVFPGIANC